MEMPQVSLVERHALYLNRIEYLEAARSNPEAIVEITQEVRDLLNSYQSFEGDSYDDLMAYLIQSGVLLSPSASRAIDEYIWTTSEKRLTACLCEAYYADNDNRAVWLTVLESGGIIPPEDVDNILFLAETIYT